ncbi:hypothetical protein [Sunxiuqinia indica]|uniref:hypothetical protein n=1 Tax=Sunxiuqinia indica TaxID=2692584 RepID=UPI00135976B4|nr:hypothetical protein [Sunxiuqinia indica]
MKHLVLVFGFIFLSMFSGIAQSENGIVVRKYRNQQTWLIKEGAKITIKKDGQKYKGKFKIIDKESILVNSDTIKINQIQELYAKLSTSNFTGGVFTLLGSWTGVGGISGTVMAVSEGGFAILAIPFAAGIGTFGTLLAIKGVQLLSRGRKFNTAKWEYLIIQEPSLIPAN